MIHMIHRDNLDQELGEILWDITYIQVEGEIPVQNQHQYMDQLISLNWVFNTQ